MGNPDAKAAAQARKAQRQARRAAGGGKRKGKRLGTGRKRTNGHSDGLPKKPTD